ncbi:hypothetical protein AYO49_06355 [Verrucomicrobiaceae bacterium SCGC AG-212-N21]|nr:hypothetical protein AYO49_06355 [Verrucomicrobiaceae bacterium SCGC AG-212-N21]
MTHFHYHFLHVLGLIIMIAGFGSLVSGDDKARRIGGMLHGIGWLILGIAAFGFIAKFNKTTTAPISYGSVYVIVKLVIWVVLGALPVLGKKGILPRPAVLIIAILLASTAAFIGFFKPLAMQ